MATSSPMTVSPPAPSAVAISTAAAGESELDALLLSLHELEHGHRTDVLSRLCAFASEGDVARRHILAQRLRSGLPVLHNGTDDEQALVMDLIISLLTDHANYDALAFNIVYGHTFLSLLSTTAVENAVRVTTQFVTLLRTLWTLNALHKSKRRTPWLLRELVQLAERGSYLAWHIVCQWMETMPSHQMRSVSITALVEANLVRACVSVLRRPVEADKALLVSVLRILNTIARVWAGSRELVKLDVINAAMTLLLVTSSLPRRRGLRQRLATLLYPLWWRHASARALVATNGCLDVLVDMLCSGSRKIKTAAANALAAACKDTLEAITRVPMAELLAVCEEMLGDDDGREDDQHGAAQAALQLVTTMAYHTTAWETLESASMVARVLRLLEHGTASVQIEATYAVVALVTIPSCRQHLLETANVESVLEAITSERVRPWAQQALRRWRMGVHVKTNDDPFEREVDGFCLLETDDWPPSDADEDDEQDDETKAKMKAMMDRFHQGTREDSSTALLTIATDIGDAKIPAHELARFGVIDVFVERFTAALFDCSTSGLRKQLEVASTTTPSTAAGLQEIFRGAMALIRSGDYSGDESAARALHHLATFPTLSRLLLQADAVRFCAEMIEDATRSHTLQRYAISLLCDLALSPAHVLVLDTGVADGLMVMAETFRTRKPFVKGIRRVLHARLVLLARRHRAVRALVLANPQLVAVHVAYLTWTPGGLRLPTKFPLPSPLRLLARTYKDDEEDKEEDKDKEKEKEEEEEEEGEEETFVTVDRSTACMPTALLHGDDPAFKVHELRALVPRLNDPFERAQLLDAGLEESLKEAQASSDQFVRMWVRAVLYWVRASMGGDTVESVVTTYPKRDVQQKTAAVKSLLTMETPLNDATAIGANVFALLVAAFQAGKKIDKDAREDALPLLQWLQHHDAPVVRYVAVLEDMQRSNFVDVLVTQLEIEPRVSMTRGILHLVQELMTTHAKTRLRVGDKLPVLINVVRNGTADKDRQVAASLVLALLDGHTQLPNHGEKRNLVVATHVGLVQAFMALFTSVQSREQVTKVMTQLVDKLQAIRVAVSDQSKAASQCLIVLCRAMLFQAKTASDSGKATLAMELLIQWTRASSDGAFLRSLVDAGAIAVVSHCLELQEDDGGDEERMLGAVGLAHALALVELIAAVADQKPKLTQGDATIADGLRKLLGSTTLTEEKRTAIQSVVDMVLVDGTTTETAAL